MPEDKGLSTSGKSPRAEKEEKILAFWKDNAVFERTLEKESPEGEFVFYEGPPTANAKPAFHHLEARAFKDALPRYKTMRGFHVPRRAGWDTHGLPVELQIEKKLGFVSKKDIEAYGVEKFNAECKQSVFEYIGDWEKFTERIGYWVDFDDAYYTFENSYIEAVWSVLEKVEERRLLYKDYKVLPWCPRCGTALSSHELAQGYQDVKDLSLFVKFKQLGEDKTYFLAWTTTPWTLPGNIALAVGPDMDYVKIRIADEVYILAESRLGIIEGEYEIIEKMKGQDLVGLEYEPLYPFVSELASDSERPKLEKAFKVYAADFVTTDDGTGIVHTAVMYGQDDFVLGTKEGLPKVHLVTPEGLFMKGTGSFEGRSVVEPELAVDILKDLQGKGNYFGKENHAHSYPFCWRCKTRLIYYARDSWYIRMSELRDNLIRENKKINWEPEYIKEGRFGEWLREVKDWAISRERYWGTPLPVWQNAESTKRIVAGSIETLKKYAKRSGNRYFVMRHGEAQSNVQEILNGDKTADINLTEIGREKVRQSADFLKDKKITKIFSSEFQRTKQTAGIVKEVLGLDADIIVDQRLNETQFGTFDGKNRLEYRSAYRTGTDFDAKPEGGESLNDIKKRMGRFLYDIESTYTSENVLIVSHGDPLWMLDAAAQGYSPEETVAAGAEWYLETGNARELPFVPLPHDENFQIDLHKPFIDDIVLEKDGEDYRRVKEVMDVWLDSGSMPFAQGAAHREDPGDFSHIEYPADFISEAIDQTRGWFYTLHAVGTLMGRGSAFLNAVCLGHILDKEGKKMSKSVGNILDPWEMMDKYGVDTLRLWMYSVNQPGESKNFDERSVDEIQKRVFNLLDNTFTFYELYRDKSLETSEEPQSGNVLDRWIVARLAELSAGMTEKLDAYKLLEPVRDMRAFIDDFSTWYVRRSRDRLKEGDKEAKQTMYFVLRTISKLLAPFAPFAAEDLYQKLRLESDPLSVHMAEWPHVETTDGEVIRAMAETRRIASLGLEARSRANIKIRQPLASLSIRLGDAYADIIKDEVNVKEIIDTDMEGVILDTTLTPELIEEGSVRELIRKIQEMRKEKDLKPGDVMRYEVPEEEKELFSKFSAEIRKATNIELA